MKNFLKKNGKAIGFVSLAILLLVVAVMGWHWTEVARQPFWWSFWVVAAILSLIGFIALMFKFGSTKKNNKW